MGRGRRRKRKRRLAAPPAPWWRTVAKAGAVAGSVIAAVAGLTNVVDWLHKQISPQIPALSAHIDGVRLRDEAQSLGDYVRETRPRDRSYTPAELARPGYSFLLALSARGKEGTKYRLRWELHDVVAGRVSGPDYNQIAASFTTAARNQQRSWPVWVPWPRHSGQYFVRFTLEDSARRPIDERDSRTFRFKPSSVFPKRSNPRRDDRA
jgi:hypothetical protein